MGRIRAPIVFRVGDARRLAAGEHGLEVGARVTLQTRDDELEHISRALSEISRVPIQSLDIVTRDAIHEDGSVDKRLAQFELGLNLLRGVRSDGRTRVRAAVEREMNLGSFLDSTNLAARSSLKYLEPKMLMGCGESLRRSPCSMSSNE